MQDGTLLAAVDLGSNSFRLEIGRLEHGFIHRLEYHKETVRQGGGLDEDHNLSPQAMQRGWDCLARFAERLAGFAPGRVRAVATQTLREARNREAFIGRGSEILGFPIDVVSGEEEARLIYQGVSRLLPQSDERRLVVDVGGRSTELILGRQFEAGTVASYPVGSVAWSARYFADGAFTRRAFTAAETAARAALEDAAQAYDARLWDVAYGSSGTMGALGTVLAAAGHGEGRITRAGLDWLHEQLLRAQHAERVRLDGLKEDRRPVIGGGVSIVRALFDLLGLQQITVAQGALRQGALYELLERDRPGADLRSSSVQGLVQRFGVDEAHAARVAGLAGRLFAQAAPAGSEDAARQLQWAARLHEVGRRISHDGYHRHGAYILDHADAAGFAQAERHALGRLVLGHRGKLRRLEPALADPVFALQLMCLRTAVAVCHARREPDVQGLQLRLHGGRCTVHSRRGWADAYPLSAHLLREEALAWHRTPWEYAAELA